MLNRSLRGSEKGTTLIEVLVTMLILAFGLLGLAGLQNRVQTMNYEAFQRSQAILLMSEMADRINANSGNAGGYVLAGTLGTGDAQPADCSTKAAGAARDQCEWSNALKGATEKKSTASVGAMTGALGCITQVSTADLTPGVCKPAKYRVTVAWQGLYATKAPSLTCGKDSFGSDDSFRRAISVQTVVGLPGCS